VVLLWAIVPVVPALRTPIEAPGPWQTAATIAARHRLAGNAYVEYAWGAYLHWRGLPLRPLIDAHGDPYPNAVWAEHLTLLRATGGWRDVLERRAIGVVIVVAGSPLARVLEHDRSWRTVAVDGGVAAFERVPGKG
jgi:hypothetical protein